MSSPLWLLLMSTQASPVGTATWLNIGFLSLWISLKAHVVPDIGNNPADYDECALFRNMTESDSVCGDNVPSKKITPPRLPCN